MVDREKAREKWQRVQETRAQERLRELYGEKLAASVSAVVGKSLSIEDFKSDVADLPGIDWPSDIREASGLVAAYIDRTDACKLLKVIRENVGPLSGQIGFHEKSYLGFAKVQGVDPERLLSLAESAEDSVVLYSDAPEGVLLVDCYGRNQYDRPFSVLVQGAELIRAIGPAFLELTNSR